MLDTHQELKTAQKTVMICDDDEDILKLFGRKLESKYNTILVSSSKYCIEKFIEMQDLEKKIHLLLLDYRLDGMTGDAVARKIKEHDGETKIILISAYM